MHYTIFSELSMVIALAAGIALVMRLIKQPLIIGHIITGIVVGPSVLHLVKSPQTFEVFSSIGIALLLFIIGLGLNPKVIKDVGKVAGIAGLFQVLASAALGWSVGTLLGLTSTESLFLGIALSFSSTIIILKLLTDKKEQSRLYGKVTIGLLLVQDILAATALLFVTANGAKEGFSLAELGRLTLKGSEIAVPLLLVGNFILPRLHKLIAGSQEFLFLFAIGWGFGFAALFEIAGFSLEMGALLAGISLASLPYTQEISARLRPLRDFFIIVFFIALGTRLSFGAIDGLWPAIGFASLIVIVFKPLVILLMMGMMGYTKRTSFKAAIAMGQVSEFSLIFVILGARQGLISDHVVVIVTMVALMSIATSTYMIMYSDKIYGILERYLDMFERSKPNFEHRSKQHFDLILLGYQKGGHEFVKVFKELKKPYVVIDYDPEVIDILEQNKFEHLYGDAMDIELLEEAGLDKAKLIVSTITDHDTTEFLLKLIQEINREAVFVCHADDAMEATAFYDLGASYVMLPHYLGSEKIGAFIRKNGLKKSEFNRFRKHHLEYLQAHYELFAPTES